MSKGVTKTKYKGYKIITWFVYPIGYTFKITKRGAEVYTGAGEQDIYNHSKYAEERAKSLIDTGLNVLRICKIHNEHFSLMIRTDAHNEEINNLLYVFIAPENIADINEAICEYLNKNLTTGKVENITKKETEIK